MASKHFTSAQARELGTDTLLALGSVEPVVVADGEHVVGVILGPHLIDGLRRAFGLEGPDGLERTLTRISAGAEFLSAEEAASRMGVDLTGALGSAGDFQPRMEQGGPLTR